MTATNDSECCGRCGGKVRRGRLGHDPVECIRQLHWLIEQHEAGLHELKTRLDAAEERIEDLRAGPRQAGY